MLLILASIIIILILFFISHLLFTFWFPSLPHHFSNIDFFYYGHRGAPHITPENTLLSFDTAVKKNMDGLELDIQLSRDGQMVVYHDKFINYNNKEILISSLDLLTIKTIDVKNKFEELDFQGIPTLNEVINILPKNIILNIEIKSYGWNNSKITEKLLMFINQKSIQNQVVISSFNPFIIKQIKKMNDSIYTAFIWSSKSYYSYKLFSYYAKPDAFHVNIQDVNKHMVDWFYKKNINIYAYTINTKSDLEKALKYNLNGIFTDNPDMKNV